MEKTEKSAVFPSYYAPESVRRILTPSPFARENLFYVQEAGYLRLLQSHAGTQRSSLDSYLIAAVESGSGTLTYEGQRWPLAAGQCFWVDCRRPHGYRSAPDDPWALRWVHFNGHSAPAFYRLFAEAGPPVWTPADSAAVIGPLDRVLAAAARWDAAAERTASAEVAALLACAVNQATRAEPLPDSTARRLDEIHAWLEAHYAEPVTLDGLSARFFVSKYYLARSFKQRFGMTVIACLNELRIDAAKRMLRYTDLTLGQVAARCGFQEQSYFTRRFRAAEGVTARAYRTAWQGRSTK